MSPKQRIVIDHVKANGRITLLEAVGLIGGNIYNNQSKHVGTVLSNMVKRGMLSRVKPGLFSRPQDSNELFQSAPIHEN